LTSGLSGGQSGQFHSLVIVGIEKDAVTVLDPLVGEHNLTRDEFQAAWAEMRFLTIVIDSQSLILIFSDLPSNLTPVFTKDNKFRRFLRLAIDSKISYSDGLCANYSNLDAPVSWISD
jgi:ABC-type bacteriocin/lantibiotic exporter with double-glycine peptidase domain